MTSLNRRFPGIALSFVALCLCAFNAQAKETEWEGTLIKITDGDTVKVQADDLKVGDKVPSIRMLGLDTPESHFQVKGKLTSQDPWGDQATDHLHDLVNAAPAKLNRGGQITNPVADRRTGKPIRVTVRMLPTQDTHNRNLGYILFKGVNLNLQMVKDGWAHPYIYCTEKENCGNNSKWLKENLAQEFGEACRDARQKKLGIFNGRNPIQETPSEFRRRNDGHPSYQYIGDFQTKKLYKPGADTKNRSGKYQVDPCNVIRFENEQLALDQGFRY